MIWVLEGHDKMPLKPTKDCKEIMAKHEGVVMNTEWHSEEPAHHKLGANPESFVVASNAHIREQR